MRQGLGSNTSQRAANACLAPEADFSSGLMKLLRFRFGTGSTASLFLAISSRTSSWPTPRYPFPVLINLNSFGKRSFGKRTYSSEKSSFSFPVLYSSLKAFSSSYYQRQEKFHVSNSHREMAERGVCHMHIIPIEVFVHDLGFQFQ